MLTLHIEAETFEELRDKATAALYRVMPQGVPVDVSPAPKATRAKKAAPEPEPEPDAPAPAPAPKVSDLQMRFEALVKKDYDSALSILDALGVANFRQSIAEGHGAQVELALMAFE
jgi:hypothetical protein